MNSNSKKEMREACHLLAEHIMRFKTRRHSQEWLKEAMLEVLLDKGNIASLADDYADEYEYAEVENPYLVEVLKAYDEEV